MTENRIRIRLAETAAPSGEIALSDLAAIGSRLQELSTRTGRWILDITGPGRSPRALAELSDLRLAGLEAGSTVLDIARGPTDTLDVADPVERDIEGTFWQVIAGIANDAPPPQAPAAVRESALGLLEALDHAAGRVEVTRIGDGARVDFRPRERARAVWAPHEADAVLGTVSVTGRVEMVDLASGRFRLHDDADNQIALDRVADPDAAAYLIGKVATARGTRAPGQRRGLVLVDATLSPASPLPDSWLTGGNSDTETWARELSKPGPDPAGAAEMSDDEFASFLAAARGA